MTIKEEVVDLLEELFPDSGIKLDKVAEDIIELIFISLNEHLEDHIRIKKEFLPVNDKPIHIPFCQVINENS